MHIGVAYLQYGAVDMTDGSGVLLLCRMQGFEYIFKKNMQNHAKSAF